MKRVFAVIAMLLAVFSVSAASMISQPAATVNLIRNSVITVEDLNAEVERFRNAGMQNVTAQDVLQTMINDEVFIQGAERDGIVINDRQIDSLYKQVFNNAVQQADGFFVIAVFIVWVTLPANGRKLHLGDLNDCRFVFRHVKFFVLFFIVKRHFVLLFLLWLS